MDKVTKPFQILSGGYQIIFKNGKWSQVFGSEAKKKSFAHEDRRGHRSEQRAAKKLRRAEVRLVQGSLSARLLFLLNCQAPTPAMRRWGGAADICHLRGERLFRLTKQFWVEAP